MLWLEASGHNPGGRHCCYRALRTVLYWWYREFDEPDWWRNPFKKAKPPKLPDHPPKPVSQDNFHQLIDACKGRSWHAVRDRAIIHTLLASGLRASELCRLQIDNVNLRARILRVRDGKGAKDRTTVINSPARKAIRSWLRHRGVGP